MLFLHLSSELDQFVGRADDRDIHITIVKILQFLYNLAQQIAADFFLFSFYSNQVMELSQEMATVSLQLDWKVFARVILALFQRGEKLFSSLFYQFDYGMVLFLISLAVLVCSIELQISVVDLLSLSFSQRFDFDFTLYSTVLFCSRSNCFCTDSLLLYKVFLFCFLPSLIAIFNFI